MRWSVAGSIKCAAVEQGRIDVVHRIQPHGRCG